MFQLKSDDLVTLTKVTHKSMFNISQKFINLPSQDKATKHIYPTRFIKPGIQGFAVKD